MCLDSLHKFHWRFLTLTWFLHCERGVLWLDGLWNKYYWLSIEGKVFLFCDKLLLWRSVPVRRQPINHPLDICVKETALSFCLNILILDNDDDAERRLWHGCCPCGKGQTLWEGKAIVVIFKWMTTKISHYMIVESFSSPQLFHPNQSKQYSVRNSVWPHMATTPYFVYAGFSLSTISAVTLHK